MERQIKFRGYNLKNKKWIYGYYFVNRGKHFIADDGLAAPGATWEDFEVDSKSVGQYVCTTFAGVDIYEGDCVRRYFDEGRYECSIIGYVRFHKPNLMWYIVDCKTFSPIAHINYESLIAKYEVIGNEYEKKTK